MAWRHSLHLRFELEDERGRGGQRRGDQDECAQRHARRCALFISRKMEPVSTASHWRLSSARRLSSICRQYFPAEAEPREISIADLEPCARDLTEAPRLLIKTGRWRDSAIFPIRIPVLAHAVPAWLRARGVILLGVDLPSVDAIDSKDLSNHHGLAEAGIAIVESLDLAKRSKPVDTTSPPCR